VPGTIKPVAYVIGLAGGCFLFTAGGRYYLWSEGRLAVLHMEFSSPKEFLVHALQGDGDYSLKLGSATIRLFHEYLSQIWCKSLGPNFILDQSNI
jgi:hypothetical protein